MLYISRCYTLLTIYILIKACLAHSLSVWNKTIVKVPEQAE